MTSCSIQLQTEQNILFLPLLNSTSEMLPSYSRSGSRHLSTRLLQLSRNVTFVFLFRLSSSLNSTTATVSNCYLRILVQALVISQLDYCNCLPSSTLQSLSLVLHTKRSWFQLAYTAKTTCTSHACPGASMPP